MADDKREVHETSLEVHPRFPLIERLVEAAVVLRTQSLVSKFHAVWHGTHEGSTAVSIQCARQPLTGQLAEIAEVLIADRASLREETAQLPLGACTCSSPSE